MRIPSYIANFTRVTIEDLPTTTSAELCTTRAPAFGSVALTWDGGRNWGGQHNALMGAWSLAVR